jgi:micrococcal nuclease
MKAVLVILMFLAVTLILACSTPTPTPIPELEPRFPFEAPPDGGGCDPSYPTVCIPSWPPDLDCRDIQYRRFEVIPPDPHGFDGDLDGIGCER